MLREGEPTVAPLAETLLELDERRFEELSRGGDFYMA